MIGNKRDGKKEKKAGLDLVAFFKHHEALQSYPCANKGKKKVEDLALSCQRERSYMLLRSKLENLWSFKVHTFRAHFEYLEPLDLLLIFLLEGNEQPVQAQRFV
jgi:mRNA-degrading endonuclease RelE of RelBE toxin-antitoxin system